MKTAYATLYYGHIGGLSSSLKYCGEEMLGRRK
jgi:hypothetical protein